MSEAARPPEPEGTKSPPDERKEGDADAGYISGINPDWNFHHRPRRSVLSDFRGQKAKKIAAIVTSNDGSCIMQNS